MGSCWSDEGCSRRGNSKFYVKFSLQRSTLYKLKKTVVKRITTLYLISCWEVHQNELVTLLVSPTAFSLPVFPFSMSPVLWW